MERRCYGCMKPKTGSPICPHCGYDQRTLNDTHQLPAGTVMQGKYLIGRVLGQGGFGITYLGWDMFLDIPVAIKEYYPSGVVMRDNSYSLSVSCGGGERGERFAKNRERFLREAKSLARFESTPEIVKVSNYFLENNTAYIVMEFVEGITLKQHVKNSGGKLTAQETFSLLRPILRALEKVHATGLVHRDISPDNIMLLPGGGVKLIDFGAVRDVQHADADQPLTKSTEAILKQGYAPIEQYQKRGSLGPWTDVYALCATIYYCLTGTVPVDAPERVLGEEDFSWGNVPGLDAQQTAALEKGMALLPRERTQSVRALYEELFTQNKPVPPKPEPPKPDPKPAPNRRIPILIAVGVLAAAAALFLFGGSKEPELDPGTVPVETTGETLAPESTELPVIELPQETEVTAPLAVDKAVIAVDTGIDHTVLLYSDGTVAAIGANGYGQGNVSDWENIVQISTLRNHTVGVTADGRVEAVGDNSEGQCNVSGWTDIVAVAAGENHTVGVKRDGTVVAVGQSRNGVCEVSDWTNVVSVAAAYTNTAGLRADGTVVVTGSYTKGKLPWKNIVKICASDSHIVGLKADGTVVAVGNNSHEQCDLESWEDIVDIAAGCNYTIGLRSDGTVCFQGLNDCGQKDAKNWTDIASVSSGLETVIGIRKDGTLVSAGDNDRGQGQVSAFRAAAEADTRWQKNILKKDTVGSSATPVYGSQIRKSQIVSVTFLDSLATAPLSCWDVSEKKDGSVMAWVGGNGQRYDLYIAAEGGINGVNACEELFIHYENLVRVSFNGAFHTEQVQSMRKMFFGCAQLIQVDLGSIDTGNVTDMQQMFAGCISLTELDLSHFDTGSIRDYGDFMEPDITVNGQPWINLFEN